MEYNQTVIRQNIGSHLNYIHFQFMFNYVLMTKDFLRELIGLLDQTEMNLFLEDLLLSSKIIRVLSTTYLANAITFLNECKYSSSWKGDFEIFHAIQKFKYRLEYHRFPSRFGTPELILQKYGYLDNFRLESTNFYHDGSIVVSLVDYNGNVIEQAIK